jgi:hypothetical protein
MPYELPMDEPARRGEHSDAPIGLRPRLPCRHRPALACFDCAARQMCVEGGAPSHQPPSPVTRTRTHTPARRSLCPRLLRQVFMTQLPPGNSLVFATRYPRGAYGNPG